MNALVCITADFDSRLSASIREIRGSTSFLENKEIQEMHPTADDADERG
jgi:hypothetical protein